MSPAAMLTSPLTSRILPTVILVSSTFFRAIKISLDKGYQTISRVIIVQKNTPLVELDEVRTETSGATEILLVSGGFDSLRSTTETLRIYPLDRPRERNRLADVFDAAHPGGDAFRAHAKPRVGDRAIFAQF